MKGVQTIVQTIKFRSVVVNFSALACKIVILVTTLDGL